MNKRTDFRDRLLQADGIDANRVSDAELEGFGQLLDRALANRPRWRHIVQWRVAKLAIPAVILIVAGIHFLGGSVDGTGVAWADVLAQIREFRPYRCRVVEGTDSQETRSYTMERPSLSQRRQTFSDGSVMVIDLSIPKELFLYPDKKQAHEHWFDWEPRTDFDLLAHVNAMQERAVEELGIETIEGRRVKGFHARDQHNDLTLWADIHTRLPVLFQIIHVQTGTTIVWDQFEFDVSFDEALFSTTAPEGYAVKKTGRGYTDVPHVGEGLPEEPLLTGLKVVAEFFDGVFPPAIELPQLRQALREYVKDNQLADEEVEERLLPVSEYWTKAAWYINRLKHAEGVTDLQYHGDGVRLGDDDAIIMWWLPQNGLTYRVIYGDLTIKDLCPDELPKQGL